MKKVKKIIFKTGSAGVSSPPFPRVKKNKLMFSLFGKTLNLSGEEVSALGFEPVPEILPPARFKSGNNVVHRHRMHKADDSWHF
jgi:hypothetical protein